MNKKDARVPKHDVTIDTGGGDNFPVAVELSDLQDRGLDPRVPNESAAHAVAVNQSASNSNSATSGVAGDDAPGVREDPYLGKTIDGRYVLEQVIGEGGMGVVYRARHRVIDKRVAVKVLRVDYARDPEITQRFLQEARAASSIGNPHIIDISDFGTLPDGATYFVMEHLDGMSLEGLMRETRPLPVPRLIHIAKQIALGVHAAHEAGIVHRDLKPDNVMLIKRGGDSDFAKILDFGIAKVGSESKITRAGSVFGTPHYMSPEQAAGTAVDRRTDVYALGVILYEMASGKVPFDADNFMGILTQHMYKAPVPIRALVPQGDIPPGLDAVILKTLTKKPEGRYQTMSELIADLEKVEEGMMPEAVPEMMNRSGGFNVPVEYFNRPAMPEVIPDSPNVVYERKHPWMVYGGVAAALTLVGIIGAILVANSKGGDPSAQTPDGPPSGYVVVPQPPAQSPSPLNRETAIATTPPRPQAVRVSVMLVVEPPDARVSRDGKDLGQAPLQLDLAGGERANVLVTKPGYVTQNLTLDGTKRRVNVVLASAPPPPPAPPTAKPLESMDLKTSANISALAEEIPLDEPPPPRAPPPVVKRSTPAPKPSRTANPSGTLSTDPPDPWVTVPKK